MPTCSPAGHGLARANWVRPGQPMAAGQANRAESEQETRLVKQAAGVFIQALQDSTPGAEAQRVRVYRTVMDSVRNGTLTPGVRLPSARRLALECNVTRGAVDEAYEQLQSEGIVVRHVGDGSYVADPLPVAMSLPIAAVESSAPSTGARRVLNRFAPLLGQWSRLEVPGEQPILPPLHPRAMPVDEFPLSVWRRLMTRALAESQRHRLHYGPSAGMPALREAIVRHLALTRNVQCTAQQVLILNSPMQAIELIARVLLEPGDQVWVEDPGHASLPVVFEVLHTKPVGVPFDARGLDVARGRELAPQAAAVYLHPLGQAPTGVRTDGARGAELLQWAREAGAWIIEGNFNTEVVHQGPPPPTLYSQDGGERVLLVGSFEGILFPSLRVAYLVVPEHLTRVFTAMRGLFGEHASVAPQVALAAFIDEGHMSTHLRHLRQVCGQRRSALHQAVAQHLPVWAALSPTGEGMHAGLYFPPRVSDVAVYKLVRARGVGAVPISSICLNKGLANGLVLGYGGATLETIDASMQVIGGALRQIDQLGSGENK